jgi:hypothetical protein
MLDCRSSLVGLSHDRHVVEWILMQYREGEEAKPILDELRRIIEEGKKR